NPGLRGVMANAQTPLVQLPHLAMLTRAYWDADRRFEPAEVALRELARLIYPEHADLFVRAWLLLAQGDAASAFDAADQIDALLTGPGLGRLGPIGRRLFPGPELVATDVGIQLRIRGYAELFKEKCNVGADEPALDECFFQYCRHALRWQLRHGYRKVVG